MSVVDDGSAELELSNQVEIGGRRRGGVIVIAAIAAIAAIAVGGL